MWTVSHKFDPAAVPIADRHYNRRKPGSPQFVPPGRSLVLRSRAALWITSWPFAEFTRHDWAGAWVNSCFRNESDEVASSLIRAAVAATRFEWPEVPALGMVSFIDPRAVRPRMVRSRPTWGHSYFAAGFRHVGYTRRGLWVMQMTADQMPAAAPADGQAVAVRLLA